MNIRPRKNVTSPPSVRPQPSRSINNIGTASVQNPKLAALLKKNVPSRPVTAPTTNSEMDVSMDIDDNDTDDPFKSAGNILVAVRVRPESAREKGLKGRKGPLVRVLDKNVLIFDPSDYDSPHDRRALGVRRGKDLRFAFDRVFEENVTQMEVYQNTAKSLLEGVLDGYNATVFAYGATGAGKTYTMMGSDSSGPGILPLTVIDLFTMIDKNREKQCKVTVSFLEVYNETIRDLLVEPPIQAMEQEDGVQKVKEKKTKEPTLDIREDKVKGVIVSGLSSHVCSSADEVLALIKRGTANRTQYGTAANSESSRSHAVFQIFVEQCERTANVVVDVKVGKLSLIDLAGSERASVTLNRGARLVEGANINKSLLALANCINALGKNKGKGYVPYRNSKLTRLLKDSLGGNCRTVMIANISPNSLCYEDSYNTLKYANRAKDIKTTVKKNIHNVNFHISKYLKIIDDLRKEVGELKAIVHEKEQQLQNHNDQHAEEYMNQLLIMNNLRSQLYQIHNTEICHRKDLMSIEANERQNALRLIGIRSEITRWENEHGNEPPPLRIHTLRQDAESLILSSREYTLQKHNVQVLLQQTIQAAKVIRDSIPRSLHNDELRQLMELVVKNHDQEVLNLDLERMVGHHRAREQRSTIITEDIQYSMNKMGGIVQMMYERLRQTCSENSLAEEIEQQYHFAMLLCDMASMEDTDLSPRLNTPVLDSPEVEDALRTPKGILPQAKGRRLSKSPISTVTGTSIFQMSIPNETRNAETIQTVPLQTPQSQPEHQPAPSNQPTVLIPSLSLNRMPQRSISPKLPSSRPLSPIGTPKRTIRTHDDMDISPRSPVAGEVPILSSSALNAARMSPIRQKKIENKSTNLNEKFEEFQTEWQERQSGQTSARVTLSQNSQALTHGMSKISTLYLKEQLQNLRNQKSVKRASKDGRKTPRETLTPRDSLTSRDNLTPRDNIAPRDVDVQFQVLNGDDKKHPRKKVKFVDNNNTNHSSLNISSETGPPRVPNYMQNTASAQQRVQHTLSKRREGGNGNTTPRQDTNNTVSPSIVPVSFSGVDLWRNNKENTTLTTSSSVFGVLSTTTSAKMPPPKKVPNPSVVTSITPRPQTTVPAIPIRILPTRT